MNLDYGGGQLNILGLQFKYIIHQILRSHFQENPFFSKLIIYVIIDKIIGNELHRDILDLKRYLPLANVYQLINSMLNDPIFLVKLRVGHSYVIAFLPHLNGV